MGVKIFASMLIAVSILIALILFLVLSLDSGAGEKVVMPTVYIIGAAAEPKPETFEIGNGNPAMAIDSNAEISNLNRIRATIEDNETQQEFNLKSRLSNVKRIIDDKLVVGYNKEMDNPKFKEVN
jgi:hypothetical protein